MQNHRDAASPQPRIAIAGATGRVGKNLVQLFAADPVEIVALTRSPHAVRFPIGVESVGIDFDQLETLQKALLGVDRLFISHGTSPQQVTNEIALIDAAVAAGVQQIVKLSAFGPATRLIPGAWHMEIESHLARQPVASTVLRPTVFNFVLKRFAAQIASGSWGGSAGEGRVNFVDTRDIAAVARIALLEDFEPESQRVFHLSGPRSWTMSQIADELARLLGRPVEYAHRTPSDVRDSLLESGTSTFVADLLLGLDQLFRDSAVSETTLTVEELTGQSARSLTDWLTENLSLFTE